ncbi:hypothetical protein G3N59_35425 [Paraburkholderia sp. Ac-20340]|uniref:hypothetical protein n=1 Tax=Paraburkholderia sp. Ac-20340 TaxID=2703888 RepID=UPI00197D1138|nr:hypothetical protein [Paraburkholderia sp. Ac-20340]MBN3858695.1 hypothetical protein [Paraburkholderia sp. Ac-20340]
MNSSVQILTSTPHRQPSTYVEALDIEERPRRSPPVWPAVECGEDEQKIVRLLDAPEGRVRHSILQAHVKRLAEANHRPAVMLRCEGGSTVLQLSQLLETLATVDREEARIVLGIDGRDRWLGRPVRIAALLHQLASRDVLVVCAVDGRYSDTRSLRFYLRTLGCVVLFSSYTVDGRSEKWSRFAPPRLDAWGFCDSLRRLSKAGAPSPVNVASEAAYDCSLVEPTVQEFDDEPAEAESDAGESDESVPDAVAALLRAKYANAYCNEFAVHRLLREWKCL